MSWHPAPEAFKLYIYISSDSVYEASTGAFDLGHARVQTSISEWSRILPALVSVPSSAYEGHTTKSRGRLAPGHTRNGNRGLPAEI